MGFLTTFIQDGEIRPSPGYKKILEQQEERDELNSEKEKLVICFSALIHADTKMRELAQC